MRPNIVIRATRKLRREGLRGLADAVKWRWHLFTRERSPVLWAQFGPLSRLVGRALPTVQPTVIVLSLPRSGSSWVGQTLGQAPNAAYLREPLDQMFLSRGGQGGTMAAFEPDAPPYEYQRAADLTFSGVPAFPRELQIVSDPQQWALAGRRQRRVVAKLVNPNAAPWLLKNYRARLVYLVRHPAALALSFRSLGWWEPTDPEIWLKVGRSFYDAHQSLLKVQAAGADVRVMSYEDLCRDPLARFRELFDFAGLAWSEQVAAVIAQQTKGGDDGNRYSVARNSAAQIDRWRSEIKPDELDELRAGYCQSPLPWYQAEDDWTLATKNPA